MYLLYGILVLVSHNSWNEALSKWGGNTWHNLQEDGSFKISASLLRASISTSVGLPSFIGMLLEICCTTDRQGLRGFGNFLDNSGNKGNMHSIMVTIQLYLSCATVGCHSFRQCIPGRFTAGGLNGLSQSSHLYAAMIIVVVNIYWTFVCQSQL